MFKITRGTTKDDLKAMLNANFKAVQTADKKLAEQLIYAGKHSDKATRADLVSLAKEVMKVLGDKVVDGVATPVLAEEKPAKSEAPAKEQKKVGGVTKAKKEAQPKAENSIKKPVKKDTKAEVKAEAEETKEVKSTDSGEKKPAKQTKKSAKKTEGVEVLAESSKAPQQRASKFPATVTVDGEEYKVADDIKSMDDLYNASENEEDVVLAFYYPRRNIKQFGYFGNQLGTPKSFPNDLDMTQVIYVSDEKKVAYSVSLYTEAPFTILPEDFEIVDGIKISGALEFEVYRKAEAK